MKTSEQLINNIIGQLNGVNKMMKDNKNCIDVIIQMKAIKSACSSFMDKLIEQELIECLKKKKSEKILKKLLLELTKK